ncbi:MAG: monovalent cation/H(+) antiporter subunit G [Sandaracinaceae bacterium]
MTIVAWTLSALGVVLLVVSAVGLFRLPDALTRQHAATKSTTLALGLVLLGVALEAGDPAVGLRVTLLLAVLLLTLPVASHLLARAAVREADRPAELHDARRVDPR